jgi:RNA polymerase sigma-70 factor, ECF subfamily
MSQAAGLSRLSLSETDSGIWKVMVMRVFVAGGSGAMGRRRQLAVRARRHMDAGRPRFEADAENARSWRRGSLTRFGTATSTDCGSCSLPTSRWSGMRAARRLRSPRAWSVPTKWPACAPRCFPVLARIHASVEPHEVNGQPGAILRDRDGKLVGTLTLDVLDGRIRTIRSVVNPDKLEHLGPVADAWAIVREAKQARRPRD